MDLILKEVKKIAQLQQKPVAALTSSSDMKNNMMVGFDQVFLEVLDKLTRGQLSRQIIPIMGMGGIGKWETTDGQFPSLKVNLVDSFIVLGLASSSHSNSRRRCRNHQD
ncbi:hypothetical protein AAHA92_26784 [Salvia divinorum]|uniref:Uncharacterized protein n=1 Tax=Salvia divinorum TaxID=28513 RepID=A0ABD1G4R7_SALDI